MKYNDCICEDDYIVPCFISSVIWFTIYLRNIEIIVRGDSMDNTFKGVK